MRVKNLMNTNIVMVLPTITMKEVAIRLQEASADEAFVVNREGQLIGCMGKNEFIKALSMESGHEVQVQDVMENKWIALTPSMTIKELEEQIKIDDYDFFPVFNEENSLVGILKTVEVRKALSKESLSLITEMQSVLNGVYNGVIAINLEGIVVLFNAAAELLTGLTADAVIGHYINDVVPNTGLIRVMETGVAELNQQQNIGRCHIITNRSPIRNANGIMGAVAVFQDITELQAVAAELENVKNLKSTLESAIESIFEGIVIVDEKGIITMINQSYCDFLGVEAGKVVGSYVADVIPNTRMHVVAQGGKAEVTDIQRINEHNCVVTRIPIIKEGKLVGAVGKVIFKDVKDLKILSIKLNKLQFELEYYKEELRKVYGGKHTFDTIIGESEKMQWTKAIGAKAAKGNSTVLILGESGTGKELFAHAIHNDSLRHNGPFIKVNCAAVPDNLLESELFGYDEGAFSGAKKGGKPGRFELANGGTIFLDEIGDMPLSMQAKMLRVLQEREFERVGGTKTLKLDLRIIAATNRDLEKMIEEGKFRQDLYYRLNIVSLNIPPLRERTEDIPMLCNVLLKKINRQVQHCVEGVSVATLQLLMNYNWPGNVRELENILERAVNLIDEDEVFIVPEHLAPALRKINKAKSQVDSADNLAGMMGDAERQAILKALETAGGNKSEAAKILGIHRSGFYQKMKKYNIQ
ncbi:sigma 54-interacting transcriptional regulator [Pelosinus sp. sgz500959]|uniref:sigma 54-interacting transcriptional regulator n=1 Tax=Pelosinus sp. sgz500959 TaxID=3242472 RepID=UPI00366CC7FA